MATNKTLLPPPYQTVEDINGYAVAGATVTFKNTGTAVLAVVYADADGLVISPNPVTVDAAGRFTVFLSPGQVVDVEYRDPFGALIKTVPGVQAVPSASGNVDTTGTFGEVVTAGQLVYLSSGDGGKTAGRWWLANTNQLQGLHRTLGMTLGAGTAGGTGTIRTDGRVDGLTGLVVGAQYFVGATFGVPSLAFSQRIVGQADTTTSLVLTANPPDLGTYVEFFSAPGVYAQLVPLGPGREAILRGAGAWAIHGIKAGVHGQRIRIWGSGGGQADFINQSPSAAAPDRLYNFVSSGPTSIQVTSPGGEGSVEYVYDVQIPGWRLLSHEQGTWITPAFSAADYTGSGGMTWTVAAGNVLRCAYRLSGRTLQVTLALSNTTLGGAGDIQLARNIPGGFTTPNADSAGGTGSLQMTEPPGTTIINGQWFSFGASLIFRKNINAPVWVVGAGMSLKGTFLLEVQ